MDAQALTPVARRPGFTLVELLVAISLFMLIGAGTFVFYGTAFRGQARNFASSTVANGATIVRRAFDVAMNSATYIQSPSLPGSATSMLTVWANLDVDGKTPLVAGTPVEFTQICLDAATQQVFLYQGAAPKAPAGRCGAAGGSVLAGGGSQKVTLLFSRPSRSSEANLVQMTCSIDLNPMNGAALSDTVKAQAVVNSNDQN